jgi:hypothetical protein
MYEGNRFNSPWVIIKSISPLAWGLILLFLAALLAAIPLGFFRTLAILPLITGGLFLYQAIYRNKY